MITVFVLVFAVALIGIGLLLWISISTKEQEMGILLKGKIIYLDSAKRPGETLYAKSLPLLGKPDFVVEVNGQKIPIEKKTSRTPKIPYENHVLQLISYCFLVEENYGRPIGGVIKYPEKEFSIAYTDAQKARLVSVVNEILQAKHDNTEFMCTHKDHNF